MKQRKQIEAKVIKGVLIGLVVLAVISAIAGLLPGVDKFENGRLVATRQPGGIGYIGFLAVAGLAAVVAWKRPRPMMMFAWSAFLWVFAVVVVVLTFELNFDWGNYVYVTHAAQHVFEWTALALGILAFFAIPAVALIYSVVMKFVDAHRARRARPPAPASLPVARVISISGS